MIPGYTSFACDQSDRPGHSGIGGARNAEWRYISSRDK
jgi:hypothetical protein